MAKTITELRKIGKELVLRYGNDIREMDNDIVQYFMNDVTIREEDGIVKGFPVSIEVFEKEYMTWSNYLFVAIAFTPSEVEKIKQDLYARYLSILEQEVEELNKPKNVLNQ